jgi:hypothetical protein
MGAHNLPTSWPLSHYTVRVKQSSQGGVNHLADCIPEDSNAQCDSSVYDLYDLSIFVLDTYFTGLPQDTEEILVWKALRKAGEGAP